MNQSKSKRSLNLTPVGEGLLCSDTGRSHLKSAHVVVNVRDPRTVTSSAQRLDDVGHQQQRWLLATQEFDGEWPKETAADVLKELSLESPNRRIDVDTVEGDNFSPISLMKPPPLTVSSDGRFRVQLRNLFPNRTEIKNKVSSILEKISGCGSTIAFLVNWRDLGTGSRTGEIRSQSLWLSTTSSTTFHIDEITRATPADKLHHCGDKLSFRNFTYCLWSWIDEVPTTRGRRLSPQIRESGHAGPLPPLLCSHWNCPKHVEELTQLKRQRQKNQL